MTDLAATSIPDHAPTQPAQPRPLVLLGADDAVVCVDDTCATLPVDAAGDVSPETGPEATR